MQKPICPLCQQVTKVRVGDVIKAPRIGATREDDTTSWQVVLVVCEPCKKIQMHKFQVELWQAMVNGRAIWPGYDQWQWKETAQPAS